VALSHYLDRCQWPFYKRASLTTISPCRAQTPAVNGGVCGSLTPLANGYQSSSNVGRDIGNFYRTTQLCYQQCGVDQFFNTTSWACSNCNNRGQINGSARPHGLVGAESSLAGLITCTSCSGGKVAYQGYCVTPINCPANTEYSTALPLSVEQCKPCLAPKKNPTGVGKCV